MWFIWKFAYVKRVSGHYRFINTEAIIFMLIYFYDITIVRKVKFIVYIFTRFIFSFLKILSTTNTVTHCSSLRTINTHSHCI